jgi:hypothetical protein
MCLRGQSGLIGYAARSTKEFMVNRHMRTKGRVVESAGTERKRSVQARAVGITASGVDRVVADKAQTYCARLEGLVPWFLRS